jgi:hypothetical protein
MFTKKNIGLFTLMAVIGFIGGQVVFADANVDKHVQTFKESSIKYIQETCGFKKLQLEESKFTEATPENVKVYNLLQTDEGCYYWFYDSVLKGELGKSQ